MQLHSTDRVNTDTEIPNSCQWQVCVCSLFIDWLPSGPGCTWCLCSFPAHWAQDTHTQRNTNTHTHSCVWHRRGHVRSSAEKLFKDCNSWHNATNHNILLQQIPLWPLLFLQVLLSHFPYPDLSCQFRGLIIFQSHTGFCNFLPTAGCNKDTFPHLK